MCRCVVVCVRDGTGPRNDLDTAYPLADVATLVPGAPCGINVTALEMLEERAYGLFWLMVNYRCVVFARGGVGGVGRCGGVVCGAAGVGVPCVPPSPAAPVTSAPRNSVGPARVL